MTVWKLQGGDTRGESSWDSSCCNRTAVHHNEYTRQTSKRTLLWLYRHVYSVTAVVTDYRNVVCWENTRFVSVTEVQHSLHSHIPATSAFEGDSKVFALPFYSFSIAISNDVTDLQIHGTYGGKKQAHVRLCWRILRGKRPFRRSRRGWMENIKMNIKEIGWDGVD